MNLAALILTVLALGVVLRVVPLRRVGRYLLGLIFVPIAYFLGCSALHSVWQGASLIEKMVLLSLLPVVFLVLLVSFLPSYVREGILADFAYDVIKVILSAPFRILGAIRSRVSNRER